MTTRLLQKIAVELIPTLSPMISSALLLTVKTHLDWRPILLNTSPLFRFRLSPIWMLELFFNRRNTIPLLEKAFPILWLPDTFKSTLKKNVPTIESVLFRSAAQSAKKKFKVLNMAVVIGNDFDERLHIIK
jgi:hypothetical protein